MGDELFDIKYLFMPTLLVAFVIVFVVCIVRGILIVAFHYIGDRCEKAAWRQRFKGRTRS